MPTTYTMEMTIEDRPMLKSGERILQRTVITFSASSIHEGEQKMLDIIRERKIQKPKSQGFGYPATPPKLNVLARFKYGDSKKATPVKQDDSHLDDEEEEEDEIEE